MFQMHADKRDEIKEVHAGDIAAFVGLKDTGTGDTLADGRGPGGAGAHGVPGPGDRHLASSRRPRTASRR